MKLRAKKRRGVLIVTPLQAESLEKLIQIQIESFDYESTKLEVTAKDVDVLEPLLRQLSPMTV